MLILIPERGRKALCNKRPFILILCIALLLTFQSGYAVEGDTKEDKAATIMEEMSKKINDDIDKEENLFVTDDEEEGSLIPDKKADGSKGFDFTPIDPDKVIKKTNETGNKMWLFTQAYSWPLFVVSIAAGFGCLFLGGIFNSRWFKKVGAFLLFLAVARVVIVNFAPEITQSIIYWVQGLKQ